MKIKTRQIIFIVSVAFNIVAIIFLIDKFFLHHQSELPPTNPITDSQTTSALNSTPQQNKTLLTLFKSMPHDTSDIVFLGASLTQNFPLIEFFKDSRLKNRGLGGNTIKDIQNRLNEVTDGNPSKIFLEVGSVDIAHNLPTDSIFGNLVKIISTIKLKTPKTKIYVQSVLPFGFDNIAPIQAYNTKVALYCASNKITFINLYPSFLGDRSLKNELSLDGYHLTAAGYVIWKNILAPYLKPNHVQ